MSANNVLRNRQKRLQSLNVLVAERLCVDVHHVKMRHIAAQRHQHRPILLAHSRLYVPSNTNISLFEANTNAHRLAISTLYNLPPLTQAYLAPNTYPPSKHRGIVQMPRVTYIALLPTHTAPT